MFITVRKVMLIQLSFACCLSVGLALGYMMLNTGIITLKNMTTMLRVSLIENMVCVAGLWLVGYRLAMDSIGGLMGSRTDFDFFRTVPDEGALQFVVMFAAAQMCSSITTGCLAERTYFDTQIAFKVMVNVLLFPIVVSWVWGKGWLYELGFVDYGGSCVVHIVGGTCGLVGSQFLGPRLGFFSDSLPQKENKIRERLERVERQFKSLQMRNLKRFKMLRDLAAQHEQLENCMHILPSSVLIKHDFIGDFSRTFSKFFDEGAPSPSSGENMQTQRLLQRIHDLNQAALEMSDSSDDDNLMCYLGLQKKRTIREKLMVKPSAMVE